MVCIADGGEWRIITLWDVEFGALRHLTQPIARALGRVTRLGGRMQTRSWGWYMTQHDAAQGVPVHTFRDCSTGRHAAQYEDVE